MAIGIGIGIPFNASAGFSPASLFAGDEPGVWYDPSDLTTLFQDVAGTTPVTTAGQTVALMLDKSQGLTLGPELVTNGTFDTDTDWTKGTGVTISGGVVNATAAGSIVSQEIGALVVGQTYIVTFDYTETNVLRLRIEGSGIVATSGDLSGTGSGTVSLTFIANDPTFAIGADGDVFTGTIDNVSVKKLAGNHATQSTAAARPTYQTDGTLHWLAFDGSNDFMVTPTITPATDKAQVFAGVRKLSDDAQSVVAEMSATIASNNGALLLAAPDAASATFAFDSKGTIQTDGVATGQISPLTAVVTGIGDISGDSAAISINGSLIDADTADQGTGNYLAYPMYIGARAGTSLFFNGNIYSLVTRFGDNLSAAQITNSETYANSKTGAF